MDEIAAPPETTLLKKEKPTNTKSVINQMNADNMEAVDSVNVKESKAGSTSLITSSKTLKRCLSVPIIRNAPSTATSTRSITTRSAAAAASALKNELIGTTASNHNLLETPKKDQQVNNNNNSTNNNATSGFLSSVHIGIPRSNPSSREVSPAPMFNIFAPRARRYSASYSPMGGAGVGSNGAALSANGTPLCLTPRVSQLRQEECLDMNSREVNHEREVHSAMQMSQSWEDLTLVAENWSCKSDEFSNPLQVVLPPTGSTGCSSPSPTSTRAGLRLPYGLSPSPTRRTFATRRSMSPIAMRPSQLGAVKRKFEMDESNNGAQGNWNVYSPPPLKKIFTESSRGSSPSSVCPSPDSGTYDGRMTPKLFISKLCTSNANSSHSTTSSCSSASSISSSSSVNSGIGGNSEPMICGSSIDEGISGSESEDKLPQGLTTATHGHLAQSSTSAADMQDDAALMDEKSETSSIGGCSSISIESSSWDSNVAARTPANFLSQLVTTTTASPSTAEDAPLVTSSSSVLPTVAGLSHKNFYINKPIGASGTKKYIVNHDNMPICNNSSSCSEPSTPDVPIMMGSGDISGSASSSVDHLANAVIAANVI